MGGRHWEGRGWRCPMPGGCAVVFSDQSFVFLILPAALVLYFAFRATPLALAIVLLTSLVFYYWSAGFQSLILVASILINFFGGLWIAARHDKISIRLTFGAATPSAPASMARAM